MSAPRFKLEIDLSNAAFDDEARRPEIQRILLGVVAQLDSWYHGASIGDINGNKVGAWEIVDRKGPSHDAR